MTRSRVLLALALATGLGFALACGGAEVTTSGGGGGGEATAVSAEQPDLPTVELSDELKAKADELVKGHKRSFDYKAKKEVDAHVWTYIAATQSDAKVVQSALQEMTGQFVTDEKWAKKGKQVVDANYEAVVHHFLLDSDPATQARAMEAAKNVLKRNENAAVKGLMVSFIESHPKPEGKFHAVESIWYLPDFMADEQIAKAMLANLDAKEPWLVSGTLFRTKGASYNIKDKAAFQEKYKGLLKHADAGVRGRAIEGLAGIVKSMGGDSEKDEARELITPMVGDKHPYTRSAAVGGLATLGDPKAVHDIVKLLDDKEKNTYDISYTDLAGNSDRVHHDGSAWSRCDDAALAALQSISEWSLRDNKFKKPDINYKTVDKDIASAVKEAKSWYGKVKGSL